MKIFPVVLALSLAANAALIAVLALRPIGPASAAGASGASASTAAKAAGGVLASSDKNSPVNASAAARKTWDKLRTDDLATLVTRLRATGFPELVVRRIIGTLVNERFDARRLEIEKASHEAPFWTNPGNANNDPKMGPELRKLQRDQTELMKQLLGGSLADLFAGTEEERAMLRFQIGDVAPEKLEQLYAVAMDFSEKVNQAYAATSAGGNRNVMLDSDREKINALDQAYRAELAKFLTPAENADFNLHNGLLASQVRNALLPLRLTEAEYRAVFPLYQAFQDQNPAANFTYLPPDASPAARAAVDQLNAQIGAALGPDRAADFQQANNLQYNQLNRLVARLDLPLSAAAQVAAVQQDVQQRVTALRTDDTLSGAARQTQITALAQEASAKISTALGGQRGLDAYKDNGGQWLVNMVPRPRPVAPPPKG
jgi:hypothetical protein